MRFDVLTIFPELFSPYLGAGILGKAIQRGLVEVRLTNIRDFAEGPHRSTDDRPYGGGDGMVMKAEPIYRALASLDTSEERRVILLSPQGERFRQEMAWGLSEIDQIVLICGRYEGIDERIRTAVVDREISIGDFVLSGGELPALVIMDAVSRLIPGVLGGDRSNREDSFEEGLLEYPHYTRPRVFLGLEVPEVLLSGNHEQIRLWRRRQALRKTWKNRPDLLQEALLNAEDSALLSELQAEITGAEAER